MSAKSPVIGFAMLLLSSLVSAAPVNWTLGTVNFSGGRTLSGTLTFDGDTGSYSNLNLSYFDGSASHVITTVHFGNRNRLIASVGGDGTPGADLVGISPGLTNLGGNSTTTAYIGNYNGVNLNSLGSAAGSLSGVGYPSPAGGTDVVVSDIGQNSATFSSSITTTAAGTGNYRLHFFVRLPATPQAGAVLYGTTPPTVPKNGNATRPFTLAVSGLDCGTAYEVIGGFSDDYDGAERFTVTSTGTFTGFSTAPCTIPTLSPLVMPLLSGLLGLFGFLAYRRTR